VPRTVKFSNELSSSSAAAQFASALEVLKTKLEAGTDITPHLSERVIDPFINTRAPGLEHRTDRDSLLSDWGLHHLHLTDRPNATRVKRGDHVLLTAFTDDTAYFVTIVAHATATGGWSTQDIFNILARNWEKEGLVQPLKPFVGLGDKHSDDDRRQLRNAGITTFMEVDGQVYAPGRLGQTTGGTPMMITRRVNDTMWKLKPWRDDFDGMLSRCGISEHVYWTPRIELTLRGFEEWAGFSATLSSGHVFVPAARII
jgi:hypothetical protein